MERTHFAISGLSSRAKRPWGDFFYYDPFEGRKVSEPFALSRAASARTCPINVFPGWVDNDGDTERTPRDARLDYIPDDDPYLRPAGAVCMVSALPAGSDDAGLIPASVHRDEAYPSEGPAHTPPVTCLLYTSPSPRDQRGSRMPSSA